MSIRNVTIDDVHAAEKAIREHVFPAPLILSHVLERDLGLPETRRVWIKDFGWTASGSFKLLGALNWMANNIAASGDRPIAAHSSGNFASGIAYATMRFKKRLIVVMPDNAPKIKFERTRSFGADVRTYNAARDHETGEREGLTRQIAKEENALQASPYDDPYVIAGNGVGGLEIVRELKREGREISHFVCPVSGGGLMAGQAIAINDGFPNARIIGVEPEGADDFNQSFKAGARTRIDRPASICDGLLSYSVGEHNWPILQRLVNQVITMPDSATRKAMRFLYDKHGIRAEPTGAIALAALLSRQADLGDSGDIVIILSGRNVDEEAFRNWIEI